MGAQIPPRYPIIEQQNRRFITDDQENQIEVTTAADAMSREQTNEHAKHGTIWDDWDWQNLLW